MSKKVRQYHVYKTQMVTEYVGVLTVDGNIHDAKRKAERYFDANKSVIRLCDECKRNAIFTTMPRISLNEIDENIEGNKDGNCQ